MSDDQYTYFDPANKDPKPIHIEYDGDEARRIFQMAEWYARVCKLQDRPVPSDPQRAVLAAAEFMYNELMTMQSITERMVFDAEGRLPS